MEAEEMEVVSAEHLVLFTLPLELEFYPAITQSCLQLVLLLCLQRQGRRLFHRVFLESCKCDVSVLLGMELQISPLFGDEFRLDSFPQLLTC